MKQGPIAARLAVAFVVTIAACSDDDATPTPIAAETATGTPAQASPSQTETPVPPSPTSTPPSQTATLPADTGMHPPDTRTGEPFVDALLQAREASDLDTIADLLVFQERPCTTGPGVGQVECRDDEEPGTLVPVINRNGGCEPVFVREDSRDELAATLANPERQLYAVIVGGPDVGIDFVVFLATSLESPFGVRVVRISGSDGRVLAMSATCGQSVVEVYGEYEPDKVVLPPTD
jgi:hypothetical protein